MLYKEIPVMSRSAIENCFRTEPPQVVARALISAALYDSDFDWVQQKCLEFLNGPDIGLRCTALVAFGHLARLHGRLDFEVVNEQLAHAEQNSELAGYVSDLRGDIEMYITRKHRTNDS